MGLEVLVSLPNASLPRRKNRAFLVVVVVLVERQGQLDFFVFQHVVLLVGFFFGSKDDRSSSSSRVDSSSRLVRHISHLLVARVVLRFGLTLLLLHWQIPESLFKQDGYDHRQALFGVPSYGGSIMQTVYYADSTLCDPIVDTSKGYPRRPNNAPWPAPYILMVDRGDCTLVQKVCTRII